MRLTARRVRKHRAWIAANRCPLGPGLTHDWSHTYAFDPSSFGSVLEFWECPKCGDWE